MSTAIHPLRALAGAVALLAATAFPAAAETSPGAGGFLTTSRQIAADVLAGVADGAVWTASAVGAVFLPAAPGGYLPDQWSDSDQAFLSLMESAGYRLTEIDAGGMILTHVAYRFVQERQLTEGDRQRAARALEMHRARHWGLGPSLHRWVVESVLEAGLSPGYRVASVTLTTRPLPSLSFQAVALDRPLEDSERRMVREMQPRLQGGTQ